MNNTTRPRSGLLATIQRQRAIVRSARQARFRDRMDGRVIDTHPNLQQVAKRPNIGIVPNAYPNDDAKSVPVPAGFDFSGTWAEIEARLREAGHIPEDHHMVKYETGGDSGAIVGGGILRSYLQAQMIKAPSLKVGSIAAEQIPAADNVAEQIIALTPEQKLSIKRERDARLKREKRAAAKLQAEGQKTA